MESSSITKFLICGDHVCVNKAEAEQYFEENLSIEVKIVDNKVKKEINLIELNLSEDNKGKRKVNIKGSGNVILNSTLDIDENNRNNIQPRERNIMLHDRSRDITVLTEALFISSAASLYPSSTT